MNNACISAWWQKFLPRWTAKSKFLSMSRENALGNIPILPIFRWYNALSNEIPGLQHTILSWSLCSVICDWPQFIKLTLLSVLFRNRRRSFPSHAFISGTIESIISIVAIRSVVNSESRKMWDSGSLSIARRRADIYFFYNSAVGKYSFARISLKGKIIHSDWLSYLLLLRAIAWSSFWMLLYLNATLKRPQWRSHPHIPLAVHMSLPSSSPSRTHLKI